MAARSRAAGILAAAALIASGSPAARADDGWEPDDGETSDGTRSPASFEGFGYLLPMRLHLARGGHIDGAMGGLDGEVGELLLVLPREVLTIDTGLVRAVTPLAPLAGGSDGRLASPPPMLTRTHIEYRWVPTWRSRLGIALSLLLPGAGQWIQRSRPETGFGFLGSWAFLVGSAVLALAAPSSQPPVQQRAAAGVLFGLAGTVTVTAAIHAGLAGRERRAIEVDPLEGGTAGGGSTPRLDRVDPP